jgi:hypothetical protein
MNNWLQRRQYVLKRILDSGIVFYEKNKRIVLTISLCVIGALGISLFLWATAPHGIGIRTDSVAYLWSAKDLVQGIGLGTVDAFGKFKPLVHFPPLYPIFLAAFEIVGVSGFDAARWLGALWIGMQILLSGLILARLTNRSFWLPIIGVLVLFFFRTVWETNLYAMTEPLYLVCSLTGFLCLDNYIVNHKFRWLWFASILFALSFLARYIGIAVIMAGLLFILFQTKTGAKRKTLEILIIGSIGFCPMLIWLIRNMILTGTATNRNFNFVPITSKEWISTFQSILAWIEPVRAAIKPNIVSLIIFLITMLVSFLIFRREKRISKIFQTQLPRLLFLYAVVYILLTIVARLWADPTIPLNEDRILYPLLVSLFFLALYGLYLLINMVHTHSIAMSVLLTSICMVIAWGFIRGNSSPTFPYIRPARSSYIDGLGLQFRTNLADEFKKTVAQFPEGDIFFTDNTEKLYFFTGRSSSFVGDLTASDIQLIQEQISKSEVVVIFFMLSPETQQSLQGQISQLHLIYSDDSGRFIYLGKAIP